MKRNSDWALKTSSCNASRVFNSSDPALLFIVRSRVTGTNLE